MDQYLKEGSSPLARGLRGLGVEILPAERIIPARAGFTIICTALGPLAEDHPRSRGVYAVALRVCMSGHGSSPLARGLRGRRRGIRLRIRIIPARAGFTEPQPRRTTAPEDHPRSRGVYLAPTGSSSRRAGSSPLARGLRPWSSSSAFVTGIIPARAGFTMGSSWIGSTTADHPRSRGVYILSGSGFSSVVGSSPLARGLRILLLWDSRSPRIIPARAGFTRRCVSWWPSAWDHPRSRGVYSMYSRNCPNRVGSSPLARGLLGPNGPSPATSRIIPARAGFTCMLLLLSHGPWDHPRSRGVYRSPRGHAKRAAGSSPLARGLPRFP